MLFEYTVPHLAFIIAHLVLLFFFPVKMLLHYPQIVMISELWSFFWIWFPHYIFQIFSNGHILFLYLKTTLYRNENGISLTKLLAHRGKSLCPFVGPSDTSTVSYT